MLDRRPARRRGSASALAERPSAPGRSAAARQARYRRRQRAGRLALTIEIDAELLDWLVRLHWLPAREVHSRREIVAAVEAMLAASARAPRR
jgi:hypothetical protein